jgi:hypothetical protein
MVPVCHAQLHHRCVFLFKLQIAVLQLMAPTFHSPSFTSLVTFHASKWAPCTPVAGKIEEPYEWYPSWRYGENIVAKIEVILAL